METRAILIISSILFFCGFVGLITVRLTNPFFKGLGWLGCAFAAGSVGAFLFAVRPSISIGLPVILPNTLILMAYVFLQACVLELTESVSQVPKLGIVLLAVQAATSLVYRHFHCVDQYCVVTLGLLLAVQTLETAALLKKSAQDGLRAPIWFSIVLLVNFAAFNLFRSVVVVVVGTPQNPQFPNALELASAFVFLGTGLGLGFAVFWMTSAQIRLALEGLANTDPLTGVHNRRIFTSLCEKELQRSRRTGEQFSLIMFDLDHFKRINDRHGHSTGDAVLCAVVEKLRHAVRNIDTVGRWGGEEFVALLPKADSHAALVVAQRLRNSVESLSHPVARSSTKLSSLPISKIREIDAEEAIHVTISIGVATYSGEAETIADLLHQCDTAMYQAKEDGRNRVVSVGIPQYPIFQVQ